MRMYIASGWFTDEQKKVLEEIEETATSVGMSFYSPRLENLWKPDEAHQGIVEENLVAIEVSSFVLASTMGKDMGTLFECGYAFAKGVPVVYYYKGKGPFNIMLAGTADSVLTDHVMLTTYLARATRGDIQNHDWIGEME